MSDEPPKPPPFKALCVNSPCGQEWWLVRDYQCPVLIANFTRFEELCKRCAEALNTEAT